MADILSTLTPQDPSGNLFHIIPNQFDNHHSSVTKIKIQLHDESDFEEHVVNYNELESEWNDTLPYKDQTVTINITPRMTEFPPINMCLIDFDENSRS